MKNKTKLLAGLLFFSTTWFAFADTFYYHKASSIELGKPYDSFTHG